MIVAFYIPVLNVGGAERVIINLLKQLSEDEINSYCLITDSRNSKWINQINHKIKIINVDSNRNIIYRLYCMLNAIRINKIDIVVSHLTHSNIHCLILKLIRDFKLIIVEHSITSHYIKSLKINKFNFFHFLIKNLYFTADFIVCVSIACKNDLIRHFKIEKSKIKVIYNPIDFDSIKILTEDILPLNVTEFLAGRKFLVSIGRLEALKNHYFLINSLKDYLVDNDLVLIIIGDGIEKDYLQELIYQTSLVNNVLLAGYDINPYKYISKCKLIVHPSKFEGFGLVLIEALFLKKQVISFNFDVAYEILENGVLGSIVHDKKSLLLALDFELNKFLNQESKDIISDRVFNQYNLSVISNQYNTLFKVFNSVSHS